MSLPTYEPMLPQSIDLPFDDDQWLFEPKLDGMRLLAYVEPGQPVRLISRRGVDSADQHPWLGEALAQLGGGAMILDGELTALDPEGRPSFRLLQNRLSNGTQLVFYVFDVLHLDGNDLTVQPLRMRRAILETLMEQAPERLKLVMGMFTAGIGMFEVCEKLGFEGTVAKRLSSRYQSGKRSDAWLKCKKRLSASLVVGGYTSGTGWRGDTFGALVLGYFPPGQSLLRYVGNVGTGFDGDSLAQLLPLLKARHTPSWFNLDRVQPTAGTRAPGPIQYVRPDLVVDVLYQSFTEDGLMRFPVYVALRDDITPAQAGPTPS